MRNILLFVLCCQSSLLLAQQACNDEAIMATKGSWKKRSDANMLPGNQSQAITRIDNISKLFISAYPDPKGIEAGWYRSMSGGSVVKNGPIAYSLNSLYFTWYCNTNVNKMLLGAETGTWAYVFVNYFSWFLSDQYDKLQMKVNGRNVYILPKKNGEWKGYPLYETSSHRNGERHCIIITRDNQLPWKPITQEQYLTQLRAKWDSLKRESINGYTKSEESYKKSITETQNNKYLTPDQKANMIAGLQKSLDEQLRRKDDNIARTNKYWDDKVNTIDSYLRQASVSTLQQPAILPAKNVGDFAGLFTTEQAGGKMLVVVNPSYFNTQLPKYVPQLIILYWRWENKAPSLQFKKEFEENFPVERLQAMLDK